MGATHSSSVDLRLPLTDVSGGGLVYVPSPGCHFGLKYYFFLSVLIKFFSFLIICLQGLTFHHFRWADTWAGKEFGAQRYSALQIPSFKPQKGGTVGHQVNLSPKYLECSRSPTTQEGRIIPPDKCPTAELSYSLVMKLSYMFNYCYSCA